MMNYENHQDVKSNAIDTVELKADPTLTPTTTTTTVPPPPYSEAPLARVYDVKCKDAFNHIYNVEYHIYTHGTESEVWRAPMTHKELNVLRADGTQVGSGAMHDWSNRNEVEMHESGVSFLMTKNKGMFNCSKSFSLDGLTYTWKRRSKMSSTWLLTPEGGEAVAQIGPTSWKGRYQFELLGEKMEIDFVEIALLTGLVKLEIERRATMIAAIS